MSYETREERELLAEDRDRLWGGKPSVYESVGVPIMNDDTYQIEKLFGHEWVVLEHGRIIATCTDPDAAKRIMHALNDLDTRIAGHTCGECRLFQAQCTWNSDTDKPRQASEAACHKFRETIPDITA